MTFLDLSYLLSPEMVSVFALVIQILHNVDLKFKKYLKNNFQVQARAPAHSSHVTMATAFVLLTNVMETMTVATGVMKGAVSFSKKKNISVGYP